MIKYVIREAGGAANLTAPHLMTERVGQHCSSWKERKTHEAFAEEIVWLKECVVVCTTDKMWFFFHLLSNFIICGVTGKLSLSPRIHTRIMWHQVWGDGCSQSEQTCSQWLVCVWVVLGCILSCILHPPIHPSSTFLSGVGCSRAEQTSFGRLCLRSRSFRHYLKLVRIGEGRSRPDGCWVAVQRRMEVPAPF